MRSAVLIVVFLAVSTFLVSVDGAILTLAALGIGGVALAPAILPAIAGIFALKIAAGAGLAVGAGVGVLASRRRGGGGGGGRGGGRGFRGRRDAVDPQALMLEATLDDAMDCAKKLVCVINAKPVESLGKEEKSIFSLFGNKNDSIDVSADSVEFELAALMGRKVGVEQCKKIYARCPHDQKTLMEAIKQSFYEDLF